MKKVALAPATILHPHPVLIVGTYGADGKPNLMNAAWGGICCSDPPCVSVSLREATLTYHNILHSQAFTIGIPSHKYVLEADYVGLVSGRDHDKFQETGLTPLRSEKVDAPIAAQFPFSLECKLRQHHKVGGHTIFVGEIVGILADEEVIGAKGLPDILKTQALVYGGAGSRFYFGVGQELGAAFSIGKSLLKYEGLPSPQRVTILAALFLGDTPGRAFMRSQRRGDFRRSPAPVSRPTDPLYPPTRVTPRTTVAIGQPGPSVP